MSQARVEKLLLVDGDGRLAGLITMNDIEKLRPVPAGPAATSAAACASARPSACSDYERVETLLDAEVDVIVVDTAHGHSDDVLETVREVKKRLQHRGDRRQRRPPPTARRRSSTPAPTRSRSASAPARSARRASSPASACRRSPRSWTPSDAADKAGVPVIADGGIRYSRRHRQGARGRRLGVMLGSLLAGLDESPRRSRPLRRAGGSRPTAAWARWARWSRAAADRYGQGTSSDHADKFVPEGVEGLVPYRGPLADFVYQTGRRPARRHGLLRRATIAELRAKAVRQGHRAPASSRATPTTSRSRRKRRTTARPCGPSDERESVHERAPATTACGRGAGIRLALSARGAFAARKSRIRASFECR